MTPIQTIAPRVTVVLPVYNGAKYLALAIDSILTQTYRNFKLLIIDDGSTDESQSIARRFVLDDRRIDLISHQQNLGIAKRLNEAIERNTTEYIVRMDHDDIAFPNRIEEQVHFLDQHPDVGVVGTSILIVSEDGSPLGESRYPETHDQICFTLFFSSALAHPSTMLRVAVLHKLNVLYDPAFSGAEDYDLWCRLVGHTKFHNLQHTLLAYRQHCLQHSSVHNHEQKGQADKIAMRYRAKHLPAYRRNVSWEKRWEMFCFIVISLREYLHFTHPYAGREKDKRQLYSMLAMYLSQTSSRDAGLISLCEYLQQTNAISNDTTLLARCFAFVRNRI